MACSQNDNIYLYCIITSSPSRVLYMVYNNYTFCVCGFFPEVSSGEDEKKNVRNDFQADRFSYVCKTIINDNPVFINYK